MNRESVQSACAVGTGFVQNGDPITDEIGIERKVPGAAY